MTGTRSATAGGAAAGGATERAQVRIPRKKASDAPSIGEESPPRSTPFKFGATLYPLGD